jgi:hypothetical protein
MNRYLTESGLLAESTGQFNGVRVGKVVRVDEGGKVFVDFPGNAQGPVAARFTGSIKITTLCQAAKHGREILLVFENDDPAMPIILDVMHSLLDEITEAPAPVSEAEKPDDVVVDGKRIVYEAKEEIVLRCGKASITLTRAGKVLIRGVYLLSRSSGVNRIHGGSVQIN